MDGRHDRQFIAAALVPRDAHASGTLDAADAIAAAHPEATGDFYAAAVVGDADRLRRLPATIRGVPPARGGPNGWDALTYLCFSQYLRLRASDGFVLCAEALLDAGADPNTGYFDEAHRPEPTFESALYGAAGVAHHAGLTRLLLARGQTPISAARLGTTRPRGSTTRRCTWWSRASDCPTRTQHDAASQARLDGLGRCALAARPRRGSEPGHRVGDRALHHALGRDNALPLLEALLDFGADPSLPAPSREGRSAVAMAARVGRADVLELFRRRGFVVDLDGDDAFFAALTRADRAGVDAFVTAEPGIVSRLGAAEPGTVATLAGAGNTAAVALALRPWFPPSDEALELAVWRGRAETVLAAPRAGRPRVG